MSRDKHVAEVNIPKIVTGALFYNLCNVLASLLVIRVAKAFYHRELVDVFHVALNELLEVFFAIEELLSVADFEHGRIR